MKDRRIFVYKANSDSTAATNFVYRVLPPYVFQWQLCALAYGHPAIKKEAKSFMQSSPAKTVFFHKDKFEKHGKTQAGCTAGIVLNEFISKEKSSIRKEWRNTITTKLKNHVQHHHSNI